MIGGAVPDSCHAICRSWPPTDVAPAEGEVNLTSANAWGATAARRRRSRKSIVVRSSVERRVFGLKELLIVPKDEVRGYKSSGFNS